MLEWLFGKKTAETSETSEPKPKPKQKPKLEQDQKWQYEFLVQFLSSPIWKVSILDFVDAQCEIFDNEQENKFEYTVVHNQFKQLVANLFDGMMQEIGLDQQLLLKLLDKGFHSKNQKLFNQLLLCEDFLRFKMFMVNRNRVLEKEAANSLDSRYESKILHNQHKIKTELEIIRESQRMEEERQRKLEQEEEEILRKTLEISIIEAKDREIMLELEKKVENEALEKGKKEQSAEKTKQTEKSTHHQEKSPEIKPTSTKKLFEPLPPIQTNKKTESIPWPEPIVESNPSPAPITGHVEPQQEPAIQPQEDRKRRLIEQRERLRKRKQEQRRKALLQENPLIQHSIVLQDDGIHESCIKTEPETKLQPEQIERRKELMKRIRNRIVDDF